MSKLEKAAREVVKARDRASDALPKNRQRLDPEVHAFTFGELIGHIGVIIESIDDLRAALETEAGWECCAYVYGTEGNLPILVDGYEYMLMQRPLREDGDG